MKNTFELYKEAILRQYELVKTEENTHYLLDPSPANLKRLASEMSQQLLPRDEQVFKIFFGFKENDNWPKAIDTFDTNSFRTISKFLNLKSSLQDPNATDLLAILVDFENRPFVKFRQSNKQESQKTISSFGKDNDNQINDAASERNVKLMAQAPFRTPKNFSKMILFVCLIAIVGLSGFAINKTFEKKCMIWKDDHYEKIDCEENTTMGIMNYSKICPFNEEVFENLKKIQVSDTTTFFKDGQPLVWYSKRDNQCEFFSAPGLHPITRKELQKISYIIIRKYVLGKP